MWCGVVVVEVVVVVVAVAAHLLLYQRCLLLVRTEDHHRRLRQLRAVRTEQRSVVHEVDDAFRECVLRGRERRARRDGHVVEGVRELRELLGGRVGEEGHLHAQLLDCGLGAVHRLAGEDALVHRPREHPHRRRRARAHRRRPRRVVQQSQLAEELPSRHHVRRIAALGEDHLEGAGGDDVAVPAVSGAR